MKTLIVYTTLTGTTRQLCDTLQQSLFGEMVEIPQAHPYNRITAYLRGLPQAIRGGGCGIRPLEEDVSSFDRIVVASPVWADHVCPPATAFLRSHDLRGKEVHVLLTYGTESIRQAPLQMKTLIEAAEARCASVACIRTGAALMQRLQSGAAALRLDSERGICLEEQRV